MFPITPIVSILKTTVSVKDESVHYEVKEILSLCVKNCLYCFDYLFLDKGFSNTTWKVISFQRKKENLFLDI